MDQSNEKNILKLAPSPEAKKKVRLILNELHPGSNQQVPDPYYGSMADFENVYVLLDTLTEAVKNNLINDKNR
jgi:protein-tyrosine phosphatase